MIGEPGKPLRDRLGRPDGNREARAPFLDQIVAAGVRGHDEREPARERLQLNQSAPLHQSGQHEDITRSHHAEDLRVRACPFVDEAGILRSVEGERRVQRAEHDELDVASLKQTHRRKQVGQTLSLRHRAGEHHAEGPAAVTPGVVGAGVRRGRAERREHTTLGRPHLRRKTVQNEPAGHDDRVGEGDLAALAFELRRRIVEPLNRLPPFREPLRFFVEETLDGLPVRDRHFIDAGEAARTGSLERVLGGVFIGVGGSDAVR